MNKFISTFIVCLCALCMVDFSRAADPNIIVEWEYLNPPSDLAGFYLYINSEKVGDLSAPTATSWSGPVIMVPDANNTVQLSAYDAVGQESELSAPVNYFYNTPPSSEGLKILRVTIVDSP